MADKKKYEITDAIFSSYLKNEVLEYEALPDPIKILLLNTFHAGMITVFNHSEPVLDAMLIGRNVEIVAGAKSTTDKISVIPIECGSALEAKKVKNDFELFLEVDSTYKKLSRETQDFTNDNERCIFQQCTELRSKANEARENITNFRYPAPEKSQ